MQEDLLNRLFENEFILTHTRSSGPGGQHVNKVNTRVELRFNIPASRLLSDEEKGLLMGKLKNKINSDGDLILTSQSERTQLKNKQRVIERFYDLIKKALKPAKKRIPTKPPPQSDERRLDEKRKLSEKKQERKPPLPLK
nr:aminoacyl-tRNA hydrolase [Bacteroidota bacterium]